MINWDDVVPGETKIASPSGLKGLVGGLHKDWVWLHFADNVVDTYHRNSLSDWSIEDPWEEITGECEVVLHEYPAPGGFSIKRNGQHLPVYDFIGRHPTYRHELGMRVFKRKEG